MNMRTITVVLILLLSFSLGVIVSKVNCSQSEAEIREEFRSIGQYDPIFMNFGDSMVEVCDRYGLKYDFEDEICK